MTPVRYQCQHQIRLAVEDASHIGEGRRIAQRLAIDHGFCATQAGRVAIVATELLTNLLRHAAGGELLLQVIDDGAECEFEMLSVDHGPGMEDVQAALRDGHSTAGTAGNGLGAVARLSSTFDLWSRPGEGAVLLSRITRRTVARAAPVNAPQFGAVCVGMRGETECGDAWRLAIGDDTISLLVVDGLGHGPAASRAAQAVALAFDEQPFEPPVSAIPRWHRAAGGTRGAAAAMACVDRAAGRIRYGGVGNIAAATVVDRRTRGMVSHNGTLGVNLLRVQQFEYDWPAGALLVMHSDGVSARWTLERYAGIEGRHPAIIAALLYRDHGRNHDDVTVLVAGAGGAR